MASALAQSLSISGNRQNENIPIPTDASDHLVGLIQAWLLSPAHIAERDKVSMVSATTMFKNGVKGLQGALEIHELGDEDKINRYIKIAAGTPGWTNQKVAAAFYLTIFQSHSRDDVAQKLGVTRNTVCAKLQRSGFSSGLVDRPGIHKAKASPTPTPAPALVAAEKPAIDPAVAAANEARRLKQLAAATAGVDELIAASETQRLRVGGQRLQSIQRFAEFHQPFGEAAAADFNTATPLMADGESVFGALTHKTMPFAAVWTANREMGSAGWRMMAESAVRPTATPHEHLQLSYTTVTRGGKTVYQISGRTLVRPSAAYFTRALKAAGLTPADLHSTWHVTPNYIGADGLCFNERPGLGAIPLSMATDNPAGVTLFGLKGGYTDSDLADIVKRRAEKPKPVRVEGKRRDIADDPRLSNELRAMLRGQHY